MSVVVVEDGVRAAEVVVMVAAGAVGNAVAAIGLARHEAVVVQAKTLLARGVVPAKGRTAATDVGARIPIVTVPLAARAIPAMRFRLGERTCPAFPLTSG